MLNKTFISQIKKSRKVFGLKISAFKGDINIKYKNIQNILKNIYNLIGEINHFLRFLTGRPWRPSLLSISLVLTSTYTFSRSTLDFSGTKSSLLSLSSS